MFMDDSCLFPFFDFEFEEKQNKNTIFFSFFEGKTNLFVNKKLHFIWKIITNSILYFHQGNELNQSNNDHEMNNIHFVNYQSLLYCLLLSNCVRSSNNMMWVFQRKFVNNRQTSWTVKNQRHHIQSDFCSWSSKSTEWLLTDVSLWTEWRWIHSSHHHLEFKWKFLSSHIGFSIHPTTSPNGWMNQTMGTIFSAFSVFLSKWGEQTKHLKNTHIQSFLSISAIFKEIGSLSNHHGGFVLICSQIIQFNQSKWLDLCFGGIHCVFSQWFEFNLFFTKQFVSTLLFFNQTETRKEKQSQSILLLL